jgi:A/G-specific adenine glycosylase
VIKNGQGDVLIGRRRSDQMLGGLWEFPGGKQEPDESIEDTVKREILEELGLDIEVMGSMLDVPHAYSHFKVTLHVYECRLARKDQEAMAHVHEELRWVPPRELDDYPFPKANKTIVESLQQ